MVILSNHIVNYFITKAQNAYDNVPQCGTPFWDVAEVVDLNIKNIQRDIIDNNNNNELTGNEDT